LPIKQPKLVIGKLAQLQEDNGEQHKRRRAAEAQLTDFKEDAATTLALCHSSAEEAAQVVIEQAAQLETTNAALNHMALLWEHTERACAIQEEGLDTSIEQGKKRKKALSKTVDELGCEVSRESSTEWIMRTQISALEETVQQGTCGYQSLSGVQAITKAINGSPGQVRAWWVASGLAKQQRKAERIEAARILAEKQEKAARVARQQKLEEERLRREKEAKKTFWIVRAVRSFRQGLWTLNL